MTGHTHSLAEWLQMLSFAVGLHASCSVPYFLTVDTEVWAWPRPVLAASARARLAAWDISRSEAVYPLLREWDNARHLVCEACRDAVALVVLLTTSPKGAMA